MEMIVDKESTVFELAGSLKLDPYLLKSWNQLGGDVIEAGSKITIHELYDPSEIMTQVIAPQPFTKVRTNLDPLPPRLDFRQNVFNLVQRQKTRQQEALNWHLHQL